MRNYDSVGVQIPDLLLPRKTIDFTKWSVVACDQYTTQRQYWQRVLDEVKAIPSTLHMIFPEVYLEDSGKEERILAIQEKMEEYLAGDIFVPCEGAVYVERRLGKKTRKGVVLCLDLEKYEYAKGSQSLIRATEGTIEERLPPRMRIREKAKLELPHIMVLVDDPEKTVVEPVGQRKKQMKKLYDFELMEKGGHLQGYQVSMNEEEGIIHALEHLARPENFKARYGFSQNYPVLLYAVGDGNHSLATAKAIWNKAKKEQGRDHPARYALIELVNVHDEGLEFEPIHRVLFSVAKDIVSEMRGFYRGFAYDRCRDEEEMRGTVRAAPAGVHRVGMITAKEFGVIEVASPTANLPVGTLQSFLDGFVKETRTRIDYVHGAKEIVDMATANGNIGFYLPSMDKSDLFKTVILDGVLPRKTFSMGEAHEKRFYLECRKIVKS